MARIRTVKPEMAQDEGLAGCSVEAQLLAIRLLNHSDDEGYFRANPMLIKAACFPLMEFDSLRIHGLLKELAGINYLGLGRGEDGRQYGKVLKFTEHQRINRPTPSKIKDLVEITEGSMNAQGELTLGKEQGTGKGKEQGKPAQPACPHQKIIEIYHEVLPERPRVVASLWPGSQGEEDLKARWRESPAHQDLEWWRAFFGSIRSSDWRMGRDEWKGVDLRWLVKRGNFIKVVEDWANAAQARAVNQ